MSKLSFAKAHDGAPATPTAGPAASPAARRSHGEAPPCCPLSSGIPLVSGLLAASPALPLVTMKCCLSRQVCVALPRLWDCAPGCASHLPTCPRGLAPARPWGSAGAGPVLPMSKPLPGPPGNPASCRFCTVKGRPSPGHPDSCGRALRDIAELQPRAAHRPRASTAVPPPVSPPGGEE